MTSLIFTLPIMALTSLPWPWTGDAGIAGQCLISAGALVPPAWGLCATGGTDLTAEPFATTATSALLVNERVISSGTNTTVDLGTAGQVKINFSGTIADGSLASNYSGVGACAANQWASTLVDNAAPTCTQPAFSNLSGAATDAQVPDTITLTNLTQVGTRLISDTTGILAGARGGVGAALPTCSGTDKLTANGTQVSCAVDVTFVGPTTLTSTTLQSDAVIATYTAITGLSFTPAAATNYLIDCYITYTSTAATTGINFAWDTPASPTAIMMTGYTTTVATGANEGFSQNSDNVGTATSSSVITTSNLAVLHAQLRNGANATTMSLGFTPETANSVSVLVGSVCQYRIY